MGDKKAVLITGCSSGIGRESAMTLRDMGYRVFAAARKDSDVTHLSTNGTEGIKLDLADSNSVQSAASEVLRRCGGKLYALFNNGAYGQPGAVEDLTREAIREQFETNVFGTIELTNLIIPAMRKAGEGRIVMNSSVLGLVAAPFRGAYNASKFALEAFTDTLRVELSGSGVRVSLIEPGPISTKFRDNAYAAFKKRVDASKSVHKETYEIMVERLLREGPSTSTLPPEAVVEKLVHALESSRPKIRYYVTPTTYAAAIGKRVAPFWLMDRLLKNRI